MRYSDDSSGFVSLQEMIPDLILEIRYRTDYNFTGTTVDGYEEPLALMTKEAAACLKQAQELLKQKGYCLKVYDAYRPQCAVDHFMRWAADLSDTKMKEYFYPGIDKEVLIPEGYIAEHSTHTRGSTADVTLVNIETGSELDMGSVFDWFGEESHISFQDITEEQHGNRTLLQETMISCGFVPLEEEWWHFTMKDEPYPDTYFTFPISSSAVRARTMRVSESCAQCLYDKQKHRKDDPAYLAEVQRIIENRSEEDTAPYLVYLFGKEYEKMFGRRPSYRSVRKQYNSLVMEMEDTLVKSIEASEDPLKKALMYARAGNYIDFGAMNHVSEETFLSLLNQSEMRPEEEETYASFEKQLSSAKTFLLICDNCGEIVLDRLFVQQLKKKYPSLNVTAMVRKEEVLNDAIEEDAYDVHFEKYARIITNGSSAAGCIPEMLDESGKEALDTADVILSKGQGNYESLSGQGRHIFYSFLCKCDLFTRRFHVPELTGMFVEEK